MASLPNNKKAWLRRLKKSSLPSFAKSIKMLSNAQSFSQSHTTGLAKIVLKDPSITTSVLKLANSVHYNTTGTSVRTVSRAITLLGFDTIKEIMTSCLMLDAYLNKTSSDLIKGLLAKAFHTAYQAQKIASLRGETALEEIFISALILNVGELSLISSLSIDCELLKQLKQNYPCIGGKEKDYIGCYFSELSQELINTWDIAPMLNDLLCGDYVENSASRSVLVANSFTADYELNGMESALNTHEKSLMAYTKKSSEELRGQLRIVTRLTESCIKDYGLILKTNIKIIDTKRPANSDKKKKQMKKHKSPFINLGNAERKLLLDVIFDLTCLINDKLDFSTAMHLVLEGLSRSAKFDVCIIALFDASHTQLIMKYEIDNLHSIPKTLFDFNLTNDIPELEELVIKNQTIVDLCEQKSKIGNHLKNKNVHLSKSIWGPLSINNKVIGCIVASNLTSDITLSQKNVFKLLVRQTKTLFTTNLSS
ncbi:MAG: hypothetical protein COA86_16410 [Kangiella sp.]|nr:MAG: hypothetical protein COA86_16410 [Kangiella sp.]